MPPLITKHCCAIQRPRCTDKRCSASADAARCARIIRRTAVCLLVRPRITSFACLFRASLRLRRACIFSSALWQDVSISRGNAVNDFGTARETRGRRLSPNSVYRGRRGTSAGRLRFSVTEGWQLRRALTPATMRRRGSAWRKNGVTAEAVPAAVLLRHHRCLASLSI